MGIELFGAHYTLYFAISCFIAYLCSGHSGIYLSQRIGAPKPGPAPYPGEESLRAARELRPGWGSFLLRRRSYSENGTVKKHR